MSEYTTDLSLLNEGDVIDGARTLHVTGRSETLVHLSDVRDGRTFALRLDGSDQGSWRFKMVKKAKRQFKVGDKLTGQELNDNPWRRGTVIVSLTGFAFLLKADGEWISPDAHGDESFTFSEMIGPAFESYEYTLLHIG